MTYADVEFNRAPEDQHGGVAVSELNAVDLEVSEDRA